MLNKMTLKERQIATNLSYSHYLEYTAEAYLNYGSSDATYHHFRGVVYGLGYALGYEHKDIRAEINAVIAAAESKALEEAMELAETDVKAAV